MAITDSGLEGKSESIEVFIDIDNGRITVIDDGKGITPDTLSGILNSARRLSSHGHSLTIKEPSMKGLVRHVSSQNLAHVSLLRLFE